MCKEIKKQKMLFECSHWKYYLMLEKRFLNSLEFVELDEDNFNCFSMEFSSMLLLVGSELDSVFKIFCGFDDTSRKTICDYADFVFKKESNNALIILNQIIQIPKYDMCIQPFKSWEYDKPAKSLVWWNAFTDIKHNRSNNLKRASLQNVLNMLGALFFIEMLYLKKLTKNSNVMDVFEEDNSNFFLLKEWTCKAIPYNKAFEYLAMSMGENDQTSIMFDGC